MKTFTPFILLALAIGLFVIYTHPVYQETQARSADAEELDHILLQAKELEQARNRLISERSAIDLSKLARIEKLVPSNVDNIRLIIELDSIAARHGMIIRDATFSTSGNTSGGDSQGGGGGLSIDNQSSDVGSITLSFVVSSSYEDFKNFIADLEENLRLLDVTAVKFSAPEGEDTTSSEYSVTVKTYWLTSQSTNI